MQLNIGRSLSPLSPIGLDPATNPKAPVCHRYGLPQLSGAIRQKHEVVIGHGRPLRGTRSAYPRAR